MKYTKTVIESFAYQEPERFISSDEIEKLLAPVYTRLKLPEGRLELQTSIKNRGVWKVGTRPSLIATQAAMKALELSSINKNDIELLIHTSVCRDFLEPSTASAIHHNLGLNSKCMSFDLSNACLGFLSGIQVASEMIDRGSIKSALIVTGENSGPLLEETIKKLNEDFSLTRKSIKKYIANLTIGSSGVAFILCDESLKTDGARILGGKSLSDTEASVLCQGDGNSHGLMMETNSEELLHAGVKLAKSTWELTKEELSLSNSDFNHIICHQVGVAHRNLMFSELDLDLEKDHTTFDQYGNTGSAALPLTMVKAFEANKFKKGDLIALLGIGSGLHSVMLGVKW